MYKQLHTEIQNKPANCSGFTNDEGMTMTIDKCNYIVKGLILNVLKIKV